MSRIRCPGAERLRISFPDELRCVCGEKVEMWPDDFELPCPACGRIIEREAPPACIEWCAAARECVGDRLYERYTRARGAREGAQLKEKILAAMREYFGDDVRRIRHAERVAGFAGELLKREKGHRGVVMAASILHDIGIPEAERKYGSAAPRFQEREGPPVARTILERMGIDTKVVDEVCGIIGRHHSPGENESSNFTIVHDADVIVNFIEERENRGKRGAPGSVPDSLLSAAGRALAARLSEHETEKGDA